MSGTEWSARYEIRVEGILDQRWMARFEGLQIGSDHSQTVICGPVADQAALRGLLNRVCDLGLVLISVRRLDPDWSCEEDTMHPYMLRQLAAGRIRELITEADDARRAHEARRARRLT